MKLSALQVQRPLEVITERDEAQEIRAAAQGARTIYPNASAKPVWS